MTDKLAALYPGEATKVRVVKGLPAPRYATAPAVSRNLGTVRDFYGAALLREVTLADGGRLAFIDKAFPHSRYDLMLLAAHAEPRSAVTELTPSTRSTLGQMALAFVRYLSDPQIIREYELEDGHFHMCFNYDRHTTDRENSMFFEKRFHLHLNYFPGRDLDLSDSVTWGEIGDSSLRRRLLDPIAFVASSVIFDLTGGRVADLELMPVDDQRDLRLGLPPGAKLRLSSWSVLATDTFSRALEALHRAAATAFDVLYLAFTGEAFRPRAWDRPRLLEPQIIDSSLARLAWLSPRSLEYLRILARTLRNVAADDWALFRENEAARVRRLTLAGLDYSMGWFTPERNSTARPLAQAEEIYWVMQFRMFGDMGGAGLPSIDRVPIVRLDRARGRVMTEAEVATRRRFRQRFMDQILP